MHSSNSTMNSAATGQQSADLERLTSFYAPMATELSKRPELWSLIAGLQTAGLDAPKALSCKQVIALTNDSRSQHYNRGNSTSAAYDPTYPGGFYLSGSTSRRWWQHEVVAWLQARAAATRKA